MIEREMAVNYKTDMYTIYSMESWMSSICSSWIIPRREGQLAPFQKSVRVVAPLVMVSH